MIRSLYGLAKYKNSDQISEVVKKPKKTTQPLQTICNYFREVDAEEFNFTALAMAYNQYNSFTSLKRPNNAKSVLFFDRHSQDTKSLMTVVRLCKTLELFAESEFTDFQSSFCFKDDEIGKRYMLNVKNNVGNLTFEENVEFAKIYMERIDVLCSRNR